MSYPDLPSGWRRGNIRAFAKMRTGHTPSRANDSYWREADIPWFTLADVWQLRAGAQYLGETNEKISRDGLANSAAELLPAGTVVLSRTASVGFVGIMPSPMATSQDYWNWVPGPSLDSRYLWYQFQSMRHYFSSLVQGSTHKTIYQGDAAAMTIVVPPLAAQSEIVAFLDAQLREIDAFVSDQQQMIRLLVERRRAAIRESVLGKNDETVVMVRHWFRSMPMGWRATRLSRHFSVTLGKMLDAKQQHGNQSAPYIRAANIGEGSLDLANLYSMDFDEEERRRLALRKGDLLVVEGGAVGVNVLLEVDLDGVFIQKTVNRVRPRGRDSARFIGYQIDVARWSGVIDMLANKSTIAHLTADKLARFVVALPEPDEQWRILEDLEAELGLIDSAISDARAAVELSTERRAALIDAVVSGRTRVSDWKGASN